MRIYSIIGVAAVLFRVVWVTIDPNADSNAKINGLSLESPHAPIDSLKFATVHQSSANYVAIIPYGFSRPEQPTVHYSYDRQWWGESRTGVVQLVNFAHKENLKVMIKPHVWIAQQGWPGEYELRSEEDWKEWELSYRAYIINFAEIAEELNVELFCIGTEFRLAIRQRPLFWLYLIKEVRKVYHGKITYAANWDNYEQVNFWSELDYIGIDAYFPLDNTSVPDLEVLKRNWLPIKEDLADLNKVEGVPILFTEFGYRSVESAAGKQWELDNRPLNMDAQSIAYQALFETFWDEPWFDGGFLWKWRFRAGTGGLTDTGYTPQGKPGLKVITNQFQTAE
jgi:hypothetical protein